MTYKQKVPMQLPNYQQFLEFTQKWLHGWVVKFILVHCPPRNFSGLQPKNWSLGVALNSKFQVCPLVFIWTQNDRKLSLDCDFFSFGKYTLCLSVENCPWIRVFVIVSASTCIYTVGATIIPMRRVFPCKQNWVLW